MKNKTYQHKITKETAYIQEETDIFLRVYFEDELGEEGGGDKNPRVVNKEKFLKNFEEKND